MCKKGNYYGDRKQHRKIFIPQGENYIEIDYWGDNRIMYWGDLILAYKKKFDAILFKFKINYLYKIIFSIYFHFPK